MGIHPTIGQEATGVEVMKQMRDIERGSRGTAHLRSVDFVVANHSLGEGLGG